MAARASPARGWRAVAVRALLVAIMAWCASPMAHAAVFRDVRYDGAGAFDVYVPDRPGPHPVIVLFDDDGDKSRARVVPQAFVARGYLLVVVGFRQPAGDDDQPTVRDASYALAWIARQVSSYDGDRARIFAWGNGRAARALARIADAPSLLVALGAPADALRGVVISDDGTSPPPPLPARASAMPPRLLLVDGRELPLPLVTAGESRRALGADVQIVPIPRTRALGASGDDVAAMAFAWIESQSVERLQRAENLRFGPFRDAVPAPATSPDLVVGHRGALFGARRGERGAWRADGPEAPWQSDAPRDGAAVVDIATLAFAGASRVLLLGADATRVTVHARDGDDRWRALAWPGAAPAGTPDALLVATTRREGTTQGWLALGGADDALVAVVPRDDGRWTLARVPAPPTPISGLAGIGARLYAATVATRRDPGGLFARRDDGTWERLGTLPSWGVRHRLGALTAVPDPYDVDGEVLLAVDGARVLRIDPARRGAVVVELDLARTFDDQWRTLAPGPVRVRAPGFVAITQPESGERLWLAAVDVPHPDVARRDGWYVVRRVDGRYAYARAHAVADDVAVRARVVPSPFAAHGGRAMLFFGDDGRALAGWFDRALPRMGLWRDRGDPAHALFLARAGDTVYAYVLDAGDTGPRWQLALGTIDGTRFVADRHGLATYRRARDGGPPRRQPDRREAIALAFGVAPDAAACNDVPRDDASALAVLAVGTAPVRAQWCLEPADGVGEATLRGAGGLWFGGSTDGGWTLAFDRATGDANLHALLFAFDAAGEPRWLDGSGRMVDGRAALTLAAPPACRPCAHAVAAGAGTLSLALDGPCPMTTGLAQIDLRDADGREILVRRGTRLERAAGGACY